uniref:glutamine synthetase n=1 Tax=Acrobeloides nanus TaxID=290746 RepID=A0A914DET3_9BILA
MSVNNLIPPHYLNLSTNGKVKVEYVWISVTGQTLQSKTRTFDFEPKTLEDVPIWTYCYDPIKETYLKPVGLYNDPFRLAPHKIVYCETLEKGMQPSHFNTRHRCNEVMEAVKDQHPWFGMEQEYNLLGADKHPLGWPKDGFPGPQYYPETGLFTYHLAQGTGNIMGRTIAESHYAACLFAGLKIAGINSEGLLSQWEYQIGPVEGIQLGDQVWVSRFLLHRVAEQFEVVVNFDPKIVPGDWCGAGCHTNFSTEEMRKPGGLKVILEACEKLSTVHKEHLAYYDPAQGKDNARRMTGRFTSPPLENCVVGVMDRNASLRVPLLVEQNGCGYFEDRRPASNCDPYLVTEAIVKTVCLNRKLSRAYVEEDFKKIQERLEKLEIENKELKEKVAHP